MAQTVPKILSTHPLHPRASAKLAGAGQLVIASALDPATLTREAKDADIVIVRAPLPPALFEGAWKLRAAIRHVDVGLRQDATSLRQAAGWACERDNPASVPLHLSAIGRY